MPGHWGSVSSSLPALLPALLKQNRLKEVGDMLFMVSNSDDGCLISRKQLVH